MQYQNDDMDDLFRRAADGYPLKLQDEGWDAIAGKLAASGAVATSIVSKKTDARRCVAADGTRLLHEAGQRSRASCGPRSASSSRATTRDLG